MSYPGAETPEQVELRSLREHLDGDAAQIVRDLAGACHSAANYFNTGILYTQNRATKADMEMAYGIAVLALERAGFPLEVSV